MKIHYVGEIVVTDSGICKVVEVDDNNICTAETIIPKCAFVEAFEKYIYNPTVVTCNPLSEEETMELIKAVQSERLSLRCDVTPREEREKREKRALSIIYRLYTEGHINNMEQGVLRRVILFHEKDGEERPHKIPTFNRKTLEKALDYWYSHLEAHNEEQNEAAWAAINAIKFCMEHDSGYQEGAT